MENISVLNQMAEYDFNSPIDVTMIFEDSDDDTTYNNVLKEQNENIQDNDTKFGSSNDNIKVAKNNENLNNNEDVNNSDPSKSPKTNSPNKTFCKTSEEIVILDIDENLCNNDKIVEPGKNIDEAERLHCQNKIVSNQHSLVVNCETQKEIEINEDGAIVIHDQEPVTTFIDKQDMLNKLSERLIVIMQTFYKYRLKNKTCDVTASQEFPKREHVFNVLKYHLFELSYTTIESIILPRERDVNFIKQFLENTVLMANNKSWKWKYCRQHVAPFFNEIVIWAKQKKARIEAFNLKPPSSENFLLKRHLIRPSQSFNLQNSKSLQNNDKVPISKTQNNLCIFSSGTPGSEIIINITPETLKNCTQSLPNNTVEYRENQNCNPSSGQSTPRITPPPPYESHFKNNQMNYTNNVRHRQNKARVSSHNTKNKVNYPVIRNVIHTIQNNQNTGQPTQNHQSQVQYETSPCDNGFVNTYNINNNKMYRAHIENQICPDPITAQNNITSLNPLAYKTIRSRCIMCGKHTETKCSKCNYPSYCSYLCQALDNQFRKSMDSTT